MLIKTTQEQQEQPSSLDQEQAEISIDTCRPDKHCRPHPAAAIKLTRREQQILTLVSRGYTSKRMGELLELSARTIERHRANLLKKFRQKNSISLVQTAMRLRLL